MPAISGFGWFRNSGTAAKPGYSVFIVPWAGSKANTRWATRAQSSGRLGGGSLDTDDRLVNASVTFDVWLDAGTYKIAAVHAIETDAGIISITGITGATQTIDTYNATPANNTYTEVGSLAVTAGVKTIVLTMATKNASSTNYGCRLNSLALIRTGA